MEASKGPYGFDIAPGFWHLLDQQIQMGIIASSSRVFDEITPGDDLFDWARNRRNSGLFVEPARVVQGVYGHIADHVQANYPSNQAAKFLRGADAWVIAHASITGGKVVTLEKRVPSNSTKPKIPNICDRFSIQTIDTYGMLRELGAAFRL